MSNLITKIKEFWHSYPALLILAPALFLIGIIWCTQHLEIRALTREEINNLFFNIGVIVLVVERALLALLAPWENDKQKPLAEFKAAEETYKTAKAAFENGKLTDQFNDPKKLELLLQRVQETELEFNKAQKAYDDSQNEDNKIKLDAAKATFIAAKKIFEITKDEYLKTPSDRLNSFREAMADKENELEQKRNEKRKAALQMSLIAGLALAASGFRIMDTLLLADPAAFHTYQFMLFQASDILLTAGIVAGGSTGFNILTKALTNLLPEKK